MHESANQIIDLYERHAQAWDRLRANQFIERHWFERFHQAMGGHGSVLDLYWIWAVVPVNLSLVI